MGILRAWSWTHLFLSSIVVLLATLPTPMVLSIFILTGDFQIPRSFQTSPLNAKQMQISEYPLNISTIFNMGWWFFTPNPNFSPPQSPSQWITPLCPCQLLRTNKRIILGSSFSLSNFTQFINKCICCAFVLQVKINTYLLFIAQTTIASQLVFLLKILLSSTTFFIEQPN